MVDTPPTDPLPTVDVAATQAAADAQNNLGQASNNAATGLTNANTAGLANNGTLKITQQVAGLAAAAMLGVSQATAQFTTGIDQGKITTFNKQLEQIGTVLNRKGTGIETFRNLAGSMVESLTRMGKSVDSNIIQALGSSSLSVVAGATKSLFGYIQTVVKAGDELKVVREGLVTQAAASGNLGDVLHRAGENMQRFNVLASQQQKIWDDAAQATGIAVEDVARYSAELNKVPGVLKTMMEGQTGAHKVNKLFIESLNLFRISGRNYADIVKDMTTASQQMGLSEQAAFEYTTRLSMAAKETGVPFEDMHMAITSSAKAFRMFTTAGADGAAMAENLEATVAGYTKALKDSGIPMSNAIEMAQNFTGAMNEMQIGQKAFLSQMSGGPGGLMGAFQIDKMLDEGKIDQVFSKVQQTLKKQFGNIVTTAQAAQSQSAAEQMTRQIMILRQGPLGQFAKSDAEARHLLDSMQKGMKPDEAIKNMQKDLQKGKPMESFLQQGNKIAEGSQGFLQNILVAVSRGEHVGVASAAKVTETGLGARAYSSPGDGVGSPEAMQRRREMARTGSMPGGATAFEAAARDLKNLPTALKDTLASLGAALKTGNKESIESANAKVQQSISDFKTSAAAMPEAQRKKAMESARAAAALSASAVNDAKAGVVSTVPPPDATKGGPTVPPPTQAGASTTTVKPSPLTPAQTDRKINEYMRTHKGATRSDAIAQLNSSIKDDRQTNASQVQNAAGGGPFNQGGRPTQVTLAPGSTLAVNFVGTCPHCKSAINTTEIGKTVSPAAAMPR